MEFKKMGKWALAAMTVSTVALTGCGSNGSSDASSDSATSSDEEITIRVAWWGNQDRHDRTLEVIELFEELYPNINVEAEFTDWDGYWQRLSTQAAGSDLPDVIQMDTSRLIEYDSNGMLLDLSSLIEDGTINLDDVDDEYQSELVDGDRTLGISLGANAWVIVYNEDLAEEFGVSLEPGYTYDDLADYLIAMREELGDDFEGFSFGDTEEALFGYFARQMGESYYNEDSTAFGFSEETLTEFFTMIQDWTNKGIALSVETEASQVEGTEALAAGNILGQLAGTNNLISFSESTGANLSLALLPSIDGGVDGSWIRSSMAFSITSGTEQEEAAAQFIDFFTNNIEANEILQADRGVPISSAVREALYDSVSDLVQQTFDFLDVVAENSTDASSLPPAGSTEIRSTFLRYVEALKHNTLTPEEAAQQFMEEAESMIS